MKALKNYATRTKRLCSSLLRHATGIALHPALADHMPKSRLVFWI